jgi:hypothetical protein
MKKIGCPSCGAEHELLDPSTISLVCDYCDNVIVWDEQGMKLSGKQSRLSEGFSRLYRGAMGSIQGKRFQILGRVRYSFGRGFWDEWYLMLDTGAGVWITEDNHELSLQAVLETGTQFGHYSNYNVGEDLKIEDEGFRIQEIGQAICLGIEGALPKDVSPDERYPYVDGASFNGQKTFGLEYDGPNEGMPPSLFVGSWLVAQDITLDDESLDW